MSFEVQIVLHVFSGLYFGLLKSHSKAWLADREEIATAGRHTAATAPICLKLKSGNVRKLGTIIGRYLMSLTNENVMCIVMI